MKNNRHEYLQVMEKVNAMYPKYTEAQKKAIIKELYDKGLEGGVRIGYALDDKTRHALIHVPRGIQKRHLSNRY